MIIFHSFGSFIVAAYMHLYGGKRVHGIVDIGGIPISMYRVFKEVVSNMILNLGYEMIEENAEFVYQKYLEQAKVDGFLPLQNKYQLLIFLRIIKSKAFE